MTGHSYATALKTLKRQFGNPSSVASAYLKNMLDNSWVTTNDRQALRDYYYQVKACTTWCVKMGQSAIFLTPEYLSRATMRLPINLRVRWYEHIDGHTERATRLGFEKWLCKRVDTLFNPLENFICEEWNKKQSCMKPKSNLKLHSLATTTKPPKPPQVQPHKKKHRSSVISTTGMVPNTNSPLVPSDVPRSINQVSVQPRRKVLLQVLPVQIHSYRGVVDTYATLDAWSDSTLIRKDLADHLQLGGETHQLILNTVGSDAKFQNLSRVSFSLSSKDHPQLIFVQ